MNLLELPDLHGLSRAICQDGTGTISRSQFEAILRATLPPAEILCKEEVDRMWAWFEHREDGDIEQEDLAKWIMKPSTPLMLDAEHGICTFFDLRSALHPLFQDEKKKSDMLFCSYDSDSVFLVLFPGRVRRPTTRTATPRWICASSWRPTGCCRTRCG